MSEEIAGALVGDELRRCNSSEHDVDETSASLGEWPKWRK